MSDIQRTEKDKTEEAKLVKTAKYNDILNNDVFLIYAVKKTERLASALHLVTASWEDTEPLRTSLRANSLGLLEDVVRLDMHSTGEVHRKILRTIAGIISQVAVAASLHLMREDNALILEEELRRLAGAILERGPHISGEIFEEAFFDVGLSEVFRGLPGAALKPYISKFSVRSARSPEAERKPGTRSPGASPREAPRREEILAVVTGKGKVTIRDVAQVIKDCSEKTIQRELAALVAEGILRREGERRWSTYELSGAAS